LVTLLLAEALVALTEVVVPVVALAAVQAVMLALLLVLARQVKATMAEIQQTTVPEVVVVAKVRLVAKLQVATVLFKPTF